MIDGHFLLKKGEKEIKNRFLRQTNFFKIQIKNNLSKFLQSLPVKRTHTHTIFFYEITFDFVDLKDSFIC